jgi:hypothetical protein
MKPRVRVVAFVILIALSGCDLHQPDSHPAVLSQHDLFEMRQQCSESLPRVLKYSIDFGDNTTVIRTHYNARLNRCFVVIKWHLSDPKLAAEDNWEVIDAQTFAHVHARPGDGVWSAAFEGENLDSVVPEAVRSHSTTPGTK